MQQDPDNTAGTEASEDPTGTDALLDDAVEDALDDGVTPFDVEQFDPSSLFEDDDAPADEAVDLFGGADEEEDEVEEDDDEGADLLGEAAFSTGIAEVGFEEPAAPAAATAPAGSLEERLARLEAAAQTLAAAEVTREGRKVRRKVVAGTTGAGAVGFIPILLELVGAINLDPEIAATVATVAAALGSLVAGYLTPERTPPLPDAEAQSLLGLGQATPGG
jgi:hypothetical protein